MAFNHGWRGPNIVRDGLVLYLDAGSPNSYQGSGTTWKDISKVNQNNGTLVNGPTFSSANGGSIVFDGVDDYVSEPYTSLLDLGTQFTVCSFVKLANTSSIIQPVFGNVDVDLNLRTRGFSFYWYKTANFSIGANTLRFQFGQNNWAWNVYGSNANAIIDTNWHQVVVSSTDLNTNNPTVSFYVDGINIGSTFWNQSGKSAILYSQNTGSIRIGSIYYPSSPSYDGPYFLTGNIPNTQIYNRALSSQEVQQNFNALRGRFGI
jgi:hypothetical protein